MDNIKRTYSWISYIIVIVSMIIILNACSNAESLVPNCNSDKTKQLVLVKWFVEPQLKKGRPLDLETIAKESKGTISIEGLDIPYIYSNGVMTFTVSEKDETLTIKYIIDRISTKRRDTETGKCDCTAQLTMTSEDEENEELCIFSIHYTSEITDDNKHLLEIVHVKEIERSKKVK